MLPVLPCLPQLRETCSAYYHGRIDADGIGLQSDEFACSVPCPVIIIAGKTCHHLQHQLYAGFFNQSRRISNILRCMTAPGLNQDFVPHGLCTEFHGTDSICAEPCQRLGIDSIRTRRKANRTDSAVSKRLYGRFQKSKLLT